MVPRSVLIDSEKRSEWVKERLFSAFAYAQTTVRVCPNNRSRRRKRLFAYAQMQVRFLRVYQRTYLLTLHYFHQVAHDVHIEDIDGQVVVLAHADGREVHHLQAAT